MKISLCADGRSAGTRTEQHWSRDVGLKKKCVELHSDQNQTRLQALPVVSSVFILSLLSSSSTWLVPIYSCAAAIIKRGVV